MKITALKTFAVASRWLFLKIETDAGISGWGEPVLEGHAETLAAKCAELSDLLVGVDPLRIEDIWQMIYRNGCYRGGPVLMSALSGDDMALGISKGNTMVRPCMNFLVDASATKSAAIAGSVVIARKTLLRAPKRFRRAVTTPVK